MGDQLLSFAGSRLRFVTQPADEGHGIGVVPDLSRGEAAQAIGWAARALAQNDRVIDDFDVEAVSGFDPEIAPRPARHDDLVLGADLDT
jgi:hypothetical protein